MGKGGVDAGEGTHDAQTVGADDAHLRTARLFENLVFQFAAGFTCFFEAGRNDDCPFDAGLHAFLDDAGHRRRRRHDDPQIHLVGYAADGRVGVDAHDVGSLGVDGIDCAAKRVADEIPQQGAAHALFFFRGADDRHGARGENHIQRVTTVGEN